MDLKDCRSIHSFSKNGQRLPNVKVKVSPWSELGSFRVPFSRCSSHIDRMSQGEHSCSELAILSLSSESVDESGSADCMEKGKRAADSGYLIYRYPTLNGFNQCERHSVANCSLPGRQVARQGPRPRATVWLFLSSVESPLNGSHEMHCDLHVQPDTPYSCIMTTLTQRETANRSIGYGFQCKQLPELQI